MQCSQVRCTTSTLQSIPNPSVCQPISPPARQGFLVSLLGFNSGCVPRFLAAAPKRSYYSSERTRRKSPLQVLARMGLSGAISLKIISSEHAGAERLFKLRNALLSKLPVLFSAEPCCWPTSVFRRMPLKLRNQLLDKV